MSYLPGVGLRSPNYDKFPVIPVPGHDDACVRGWSAACERLRRRLADRERAVVAVECYPGVMHVELLHNLVEGLRPARVSRTLEEAFLPEEEIARLAAPWLGVDDPIFGRLCPLDLEEFLDPEKVAALLATLKEAEGVVLVYGPGALLCCDPDVVVYADMPRWEGQLRQRRDEVDNLGVRNHTLKASIQYKRSFFVDWRVCDRFKRETFDRWDFYLDTCVPNDPRLVTGEALRDGLRHAVTRPFRFVPFFDPGPWGGQWMREVCGLPDGPPNYAWCFDCVPEENSLLLGFGGERVEVPGMNLVLREPEPLLGAPVYGRMGAEFPIRTDFLDTMGGGNLSFQVHPLLDYAREQFGLAYTQDESYYLLDSGEDAVVYLGMKDGADKNEMFAALRAAQADPDQPFDDDRFVARWPAKRHDHFLIPAGTCHCSGANSLVLEISHTPYIFTFKLWDWGRLGLDGLPRPINVDRGQKVLRPERDASWVKRHLVNRVEPVAEGAGWREERTGLHPSEMLETRRHWFTGPVPHHTGGESVHVINLVQGAEAVVESPDGAFAPFVFHFAETVVIPAAVGPYTIRPHGPLDGGELATLKVYVRTQG